MTAPAVRPRSHRRLSRAFADGSFAVMVGGWVVFFVALVASPQALDDAWTAVGELLAIFSAMRRAPLISSAWG